MSVKNYVITTTCYHLNIGNILDIYQQIIFELLSSYTDNYRRFKSGDDLYKKFSKRMCRGKFFSAFKGLKKIKLIKVTDEKYILIDYELLKNLINGKESDAMPVHEMDEIEDCNAPPVHEVDKFVHVVDKSTAPSFIDKNIDNNTHTCVDATCKEPEGISKDINADSPPTAKLVCELYDKMCIEYDLPKKRTRLLDPRMREMDVYKLTRDSFKTMTDWKAYFTIFFESDFYTGRNGLARKSFGLTWLLSAENAKKLCDSSEEKSKILEMKRNQNELDQLRSSFEQQRRISL